MHYLDQAPALLESILITPELDEGEIVLLGHSLGGIMAKQIIRCAANREVNKDRYQQFLARVRKVAFLATPHSGSRIISRFDRLRMFLRPTATTRSVNDNDPALRDLAHWYREWAQVNPVDHLILTESRPTRGFTVVRPDSCDPGLIERPIMVDADHIGICKPSTRESEVYKFVLHFFKSPPSSRFADSPKAAAQKLHEIAHSLDDLGEMAKAQQAFAGTANQQLSELLERVPPRGSAASPLIDRAIAEQVSKLRRARYIGGFDAQGFARDLSLSLREGEFAGGSLKFRREALAWCARILTQNPGHDSYRATLLALDGMGSSLEVSIAKAFKIATQGNLPDAMTLLAPTNTPFTRSAAFMIVRVAKGIAAAIDWLKSAQLGPEDLDPDGKVIVIHHALEQGRWDDAQKLANKLQEADLEAAPVLLYSSALAHLVMAVPLDFRQEILKGPPTLGARVFPLASDDEGRGYRDSAARFFNRFSVQARDLGCIQSADFADDYRLWLDLKDVATQNQALEVLRSRLMQSAHALRLTCLAQQYGIPLDSDAIEAEIAKRIALAGGKPSFDIVMARFALALSRQDPVAASEYLASHRSELVLHASPEWIDGMRIEMLIKAGHVARASRLLEAMEASDAESKTAKRLRALIDSANPEAYIERLLRDYQTSSELRDLVAVVSELEETDREEQFDLTRELFNRTRSLTDAERVVRVLHRAKRQEALAAFLRDHLELVKQSSLLQVQWAWALCLGGELDQASSVLNAIPHDKHRHSRRDISIHIAILTGRWEAIPPVIEAAWEERDTLDAEELLDLARKGHYAGSPRSRELMHAAATKAPNNPKVLVGAYSLASRAGWDDEPLPAQWLMRAGELSGADGPVQRKSIQDVLALKPEWDKRNSQAASFLRTAQIPMSAYGRLVNRSLAAMTLFPAVSNEQTADPRAQNAILSFGGNRPPSQTLPKVEIVLEPTALLTLAHLNLLEKFGELSVATSISHTTLPWLFRERAESGFHQPSRVGWAKSLRQWIANGYLKVLDPKATVDVNLANDIGQDMAQLLAEAMATTGAFVVSPSPLLKLGSMLQTEADVGPHQRLLVSSMAVVERLKEKGKITHTEEERARAYLALQERPWPNQASLPDGAILFLSDVCVAHLQHLGLLNRLHEANLAAFVSKGESEQATVLIEYDRVSTKVSEAIDRARRWLEKGLASGTVKTAPAQSDELQSEVDDGWKDHPSMSILQLQPNLAAVISDDRAFNRHGTLTSLDVLDELRAKQLITYQQWLDARTDLRRRGHVFIPLDDAELMHHLDATSYNTDGVLVESAELRAIRENVYLSRLCDALQLPAEIQWFNGFVDVYLRVLVAQWRGEAPEQLVRARSNWLLKQLDERGWALPPTSAIPGHLHKIGHVLPIARIFIGVEGLSKERSSHYSKWLDECILSPLRVSDPEAFQWLVDQAKNVIGTLAAMPPVAE